VTSSVDAHRKYWDEFYQGERSANVPRDPSAFAVWVADQLHTDQVVVELGFGTARDALWFVQRGHAVRGYDFAASAVNAANGHAAELPGDARFAALDLSDKDAVDVAVKELMQHEAAPAVYGRFLIHSLEDAGRTNLIELSRSLSAELYLEFRTGKDQGQTHLFGDDHFRTYLQPESVVAEIEQRGGTVTTFDQGHGMAVYKSEDPHVARIVATFEG
jgi:hypothetical protein